MLTKNTQQLSPWGHARKATMQMDRDELKNTLLTLRDGTRCTKGLLGEGEGVAHILRARLDVREGQRGGVGNKPTVACLDALDPRCAAESVRAERGVRECVRVCVCVGGGGGGGETLCAGGGM
jgi:hypothetical protein